MLGRSIDNVQMNEFLSNTHDVMQEWDGTEMPGEEITSTFFYELQVSADRCETVSNCSNGHGVALLERYASFVEQRRDVSRGFI